MTRRGSNRSPPPIRVSADDSYWRDRPVLVTGGTGFAGGWLVGRLVELGAQVVSVVRDWVPESVLLGSGMPQHVTLVFGDIRDQALLERALGDYEIGRASCRERVCLGV